MFELNTSVHTLRDLTDADITSYDAVYLGNPYGLDDENNLLQNIPDLKEAIGLLQSRGKKAYVSTPCLPRNKDLPSVDKTLETAESMGADAVEVHNTGVLLRARKLGLSKPIHLGCQCNLYTPAAAAKLVPYGVTRAMGSYELSLTELKALKSSEELEIQILLHGKMVLGIGDWPKSSKRVVTDIPSLTKSFKTVGRAILSGKDVCMLTHLRAVLNQGFRRFLISLGLVPRSLLRPFKWC